MNRYFQDQFDAESDTDYFIRKWEEHKMAYSRSTLMGDLEVRKKRAKKVIDPETTKEPEVEKTVRLFDETLLPSVELILLTIQESKKKLEAENIDDVFFIGALEKDVNALLEKMKKL